MNKSIGTIVAALIASTFIALIAMTACNRFNPPPHGRTLPIGIYATTIGCDVDYPQVNLIKSLGYQVFWQSVDGKAYTVLFRQPDGTLGSGTPFKDSHGNPIYNFPVNITNGVKSPVPSQTGYFEYSVNDQLNHECKSAKDPGVIVKD